MSGEIHTTPHMGQKLRALLVQRKLSQADFADLVSPHLEFTQAPPPKNYITVSKQWVGEILKSRNWQARNIQAISIAMNVNQSYWFRPLTKAEHQRMNKQATKKVAVK